MSIKSSSWIGLFFVPALVLAQVEIGELRLSVTDPSGLALPSAGILVSDASQTRREFNTDDTGHFTFQRLPFGLYRITVEHANFTTSSQLIEIRSAVPRELRVELKVQAAATQIVVIDSATLLDPHRTGVIYSIGERQIREQQSAIPGRGVLDLVNMQPGWLPEANAVPHPRGSEYQTLFVVDGTPMDENRSPGFAPDLDTGDVQ
ncbi:MAG: carboxypeptidase regulatory-like domain-containing protein, partial [Candidatus Solibacter usitatus]|nr:carboxypeptidase regulatory-like domain-containing protein [Candidatus Solibacter usitatus]